MTIGIIVCFFMGQDGPVIMRDSNAFLHPTEAIENAYSLYVNFLRLCKVIFGEELYLYGIWFLQSVLAILSCVTLTNYLRKRFELNYCLAIVIYCLALTPFMYSFPEDVVTHHIMTEGLSISLFYFFILFIMRTFIERKIINMLWALVVGVLLALTRSQLVLFLLLYLLCWLIIGICFLRERMKVRSRKYLYISFLVLGFLCFLLAVLIMREMVARNVWSQLTAAVSGRTLCIIDEEDRELFEGDSQLVFDRLYEFVDTNKYRVEYFSEGSKRGYDIINACNENTKACSKIIRNFYEEQYSGMDVSEIEERTIKMRSEIAAKVFHNNGMEYFSLTIQLLPQSFVASIFIQPDKIHALCYDITFLLYAICIICLFYAIRINVDRKYIISILITLLFLIGNVFITNIIFFGLQRYVIYTFGLFYISMLLLFIGIFRRRNSSILCERG